MSLHVRSAKEGRPSERHLFYYWQQLTATTKSYSTVGFPDSWGGWQEKAAEPSISWLFFGWSCKNTGSFISHNATQCHLPLDDCLSVRQVCHESKVHRWGELVKLFLHFQLELLWTGEQNFPLKKRKRWHVRIWQKTHFVCPNWTAGMVLHSSFVESASMNLMETGMTGIQHCERSFLSTSLKTFSFTSLHLAAEAWSANKLKWGCGYMLAH